MTVVKVRRATQEDAPGMMRVHLSCLNSSYPEFYSNVLLEIWKKSLELKQYIAKIESATGWCYVAVAENEEIVGFGYLNTNEHHRIPKEHECDVQVESLYVSAFHHKRGIGRKLLEEMEKEVIKETFCQMGILSSTFAVCFYERMGYSIAAEPVWFDITTNTYVKGLHSVEAKIMTKNLDT